ncbi:MAG: esterase-like activity of phytase family protein, partial [Gramella sp.]|nr:esterase-like activity of phytase family protein [Christiangramia sp.]
MKNTPFVYFLILLLSSCAVTRKIENDSVEIRFLDEFVLPADSQLDNTVIGGLSGIDYKEGKYFLVSDQASNPRIYTADIQIKNKKIDQVTFNQLITIKKTGDFSKDYLDLEAIRFDPLREEFIVTSEGKIDAGKDPGIYTLSILGETRSSFSIPEYFNAAGTQKPRDNGVFEGLSESFDNQGYWVATE